MALEWKCNCGDFQVKFNGPPVYNFNCHCHSCIAAIRHLKTKTPSGVPESWKDCDGCPVAAFALADIDFVDDLPADKLLFFKVGQDATKQSRCYTKCCGSPVCGGCSSDGFPFSFRPFFRTGLYNADGSLYVPPVGESAVPNTQAKHAFSPEAVPEPKYDTLNPSFILHLMPYILMGKLGFAQGQVSQDQGARAVLWKDLSDVTECVPITWDE